MPPRHSPFSPAYSHRLWTLFGGAGVHGEGQETGAAAQTASHAGRAHHALDDHDFELLVVALKRAYAAGTEEVRLQEGWAVAGAAVAAAAGAGAAAGRE